MHTVGFVEDDDCARELLSISLRNCRHFQLVGAYATASEALRYLPSVRPDVILMDIQLPGMNGIECLAALRRLSPPFNARILMLTGNEDAEWIVAALQAGADGYLLKTCTSSKALEKAILQTLAGGGPMSPSVARKVIDCFQARPDRVLPPPRPAGADLSSRQQQVLELLARGLMYKEIASHLNVSMDTVRKHLQSIYQKLHVRSRSDAMLHYLNGQTARPPTRYTNM